MNKLDMAINDLVNTMTQNEREHVVIQLSILFCSSHSDESKYSRPLSDSHQTPKY